MGNITGEMFMFYTVYGVHQPALGMASWRRRLLVCDRVQAPIGKCVRGELTRHNFSSLKCAAASRL